MGKGKVESKFGCGFLGGIFQRRRRRKVSYMPSLPTNSSVKVSDVNGKNHPKEAHEQNIPSNIAKYATKMSALVHPGHSNSSSHRRNQGSISLDASRSSGSSCSGQPKNSQGRDLGDEKKLPNQQSPQSRAVVRAASGNILPSGHLSNSKKIGNENSPRHLQEKSSSPNTKQINAYSKPGSPGVTMGNILRHPSDEFRQSRSASHNSKEFLKSRGNEAYKQGKFEEALKFYDQAIALDSSNPVYRSNKSAAFIALGRLQEAILESKEAIRMDPTYYRAHYRLASLYLRLGEVDKSLYHFKTSGIPDDSEDIAKVLAVQKSLSRCIEAKNSQDWNTLTKMSQAAIASGADSAPQVFALQAEALLKCHKHQEAYETYQKGPKFNTELCKDIFGNTATAYLSMVGAQVNLVMGRFEEALDMARLAWQLDPTNKETSGLAKKAKVVASARMNGNMLFEESKYSEACLIYSEGLEHDPLNTVLLCNRAACRSKLGQYEKAIEDCTAALNVRPSYSKARLRRANCNAKLERWKASIQDYEMLIRETPGDVEVARALFEAKVELKKQRGEDIKDLNFDSSLIHISDKQGFRHLVTSPGMSVVLFCHGTKHTQALGTMEQVCKKFPSVNFLKVDVEEHPYLARTESVNSIPVFKIYRNGSMVKEIPVSNHELLENWVRVYIS